MQRIVGIRLERISTRQRSVTGWKERRSGICRRRCASLYSHHRALLADHSLKNEGDLWYFPAGDPHSIQAKDTLPEGAEFLLIFDSGTFDENDTFLLTDWFAHVPKDVLAKNFGTYPDTTPFDHIPEHELYIFPCMLSALFLLSMSVVNEMLIANLPQKDINKDIVVPNPTDPKYFFTYPLSKVEPKQYPGGTIKIADSRNFEVAKKIAVAEVTVDVGGMRYALI
jgi:oxalate decarboxylase family bicupin protein